MAEWGSARQTGDQGEHTKAVKERQVIWENVSRLCGDWFNKAKAQPEMDLARGSKKDKKGFYKSTIKGRSRRTYCL